MLLAVFQGVLGFAITVPQIANFYILVKNFPVLPTDFCSLLVPIGMTIRDASVTALEIPFEMRSHSLQVFGFISQALDLRVHTAGQRVSAGLGERAVKIGRDPWSFRRHGCFVTLWGFNEANYIVFIYISMRPPLLCNILYNITTGNNTVRIRKKKKKNNE